ncbi:hypothetical protein CHS0354_026376 [Potamilus streckersoni]|uniref:Uncharacterized protein n=1 Tax=Potamilus streckersoni TaxID=2493646 RepID=A0AAE0T2W8_9BIVA|nr:hypothetical protein CHS0354_026376 [Potamilus streckersoni]
MFGIGYAVMQIKPEPRNLSERVCLGYGIYSLRITEKKKTLSQIKNEPFYSHKLQIKYPVSLPPTVYVEMLKTLNSDSAPKQDITVTRSNAIVTICINEQVVLKVAKTGDIISSHLSKTRCDGKCSVKWINGLETPGNLFG